MPAPAYTGVTASVVALTGGTARSVLGVKAQAAAIVLPTHFSVSFDGTSVATPVVCDFAYCTFATNGTAGTNNTTVTPWQGGGRVLAAGFTMMSHWASTFEPTVVTPIRRFFLTPAAGLVVYDFPLGTEFDCAFNEGFVIRLNAPANVNAHASLSVIRG